MNYTEITKCRACDASNLKQILDLNKQPLANSYHRGKDDGEKLPEFPLKLNLCCKCYHLQLSVVVDPDLMFKNYLYVSGTSKTLRDYFDTFAKRIDSSQESCLLPKSVLDIACNDGSQLDSFKTLGWETYGVDPAENLFEAASAKGHHIICDYWNADAANKLDRTFDVITAQNVFAHTHDIYSFLKTCKLVMHDHTQVFIQTSQADMIQNGEFDTVYHEHLSFFSVSSMMAVARRSGFVVTDAFKTPIHGNSYVFVLQQKITGKNQDDFGSVLEAYESEDKEGRYSLNTYVKYAENCKKIVDDLIDIIGEFQIKGYPIIGYGAAAKGNTLLNFGQIELDYIVDDNPMKWGLFTPGMDIAIKDPKILSTIEDPIVVVPLAWNFYKEIRANVKKYRPDSVDSFIRYFPALRID